MKTTTYNPSPLEVEFAQAIVELKSEIEKRLKDNKIIQTENRINADNPLVLFLLEDKDGDQHEVVVKLIQKPDK
jgi:hypothetical protein